MDLPRFRAHLPGCLMDPPDGNVKGETSTVDGGVATVAEEAWPQLSEDIRR